MWPPAARVRGNAVPRQQAARHPPPVQWRSVTPRTPPLEMFVTEWRAHATTTTTCMSGSLSDNIESKHVIIVQKPPHNTHHDLRLISDFLRVMCPHTVSTLLSVAHLGVGT